MPRGHGVIAPHGTQGIPATNEGNQENEMEGTQNVNPIFPEMEVSFTQFNPEKDIIATADVRIVNLLNVRNVKVKKDDYGYNVVMPKTQMKEDGKYRDSVYFADRSLKEQFDEVVRSAYKDTVLAIELEEAEQECCTG